MRRFPSSSNPRSLGNPGKLPGRWPKLCGNADRKIGNVFYYFPCRGFNFKSGSILGHDESVLDGQLALLFSKYRKLVAWHDDIHALLQPELRTFESITRPLRGVKVHVGALKQPLRSLVFA